MKNDKFCYSDYSMLVCCRIWNDINNYIKGNINCKSKVKIYYNIRFVIGYVNSGCL